jgi:hypothetical protein
VALRGSGLKYHSPQKGTGVMGGCKDRDLVLQVGVIFHWPIVPAMVTTLQQSLERMTGRENRSTRRKPAPVTLSSPQIPHDFTSAGTRAATVGRRRLTLQLRHGQDGSWKQGSRPSCVEDITAKPKEVKTVWPNSRQPRVDKAGRIF